MINWPTKKIGEIVEKPELKKAPVGSWPYIEIGDIDIENKSIIFKDKKSIKGAIIAPVDSVLVSRVRPTRGAIVYLDKDYVVSSAFSVIKPKLFESSSKFLFYWLGFSKAFIRYLQRKQKGSNYPSVREKDILNFEISLPPLKIQQKIVERLDAIKKAQELNDKQIELAEELFQSLLHRELDPKGKEWEIRKLRDVIDLIESGSRPKGGAVSSGIPSLGVEHINENGGFNIDKIKYIPSDFFKNIKRGKIKKQDVLIAKDGATTGKIAIVDNDFPFDEAAVNEHLFIIRSNSNIISQKFLFFTLFGSKGKTQILKTKHGAAQGGIDQSFVNFVKIPLPPLETQQKIVEKLSAVQEYKKKLIEQKQKLQELFESVLNKSFKGQL